MEKVLKGTLVILIYIGLILLNTKVYATIDISNVKEGYTAKAENDLQIKLLPTINSESIEEIKEGTEYKVIEVLNKWCHIESENSDGWIFLSKLGNNGDVKEDKNEEDSENEEGNKNEGSEENTQENDEQEKSEEKDGKQNDVEETSNESDSSKEKDQDKEDNKEAETKEDNNKENDTKEEKTTDSSKVSGETKYVSVDTLNVREKPDSKGKIIDQLDLNDKITVQEIINDTWAKIEVNGKTGYVSTKYLSDKKTVITSRSGETERENKQEEQNQEQDNSENNITNVEPEKSQNSSNNSSIGAQVVEYAKQYLGYKYVSGGSSPSSGFDCSGFTCYVFKHFGISLNRVSGAQASNGIAVDRDSLQLGDLILFNDNNNSKIGHVGIYIGGNQFIHAANGKKGVVITSLSDSYYTKRYVCARRVV